MHLSRLLLLSLMVPACVLPAAAQSASGPGVGAAVPLFGEATAPLDSRTRIPALSMQARGGAVDGQVQVPFDLGGAGQAGIPNEKLLTMHTLPLVGGRVTIGIPKVTQSHNECYAMRTYRFERDDPESNSMRFKDYSVCQSATQFQAKNAVSPRMVLVR
jgi:hypothetical protein